MEKSILPKLKKTISSFITEEKGGISKHKMLSVGAFLGSVSILSLLPEVAAAHTNSFSVSWNSGTITGEHGHHASHASHASHGSHASHASHGSHASHASHYSWVAGDSPCIPECAARGRTCGNSCECGGTRAGYRRGERGYWYNSGYDTKCENCGYFAWGVVSNCCCG